MKKLLQGLRGLASAAALLAVWSAAHADSTWSLAGNCATGSSVCTHSSGGVTMTARAYAADTATSAFVTGSADAVFANHGTAGIGIYSRTPGYALEDGTTAPDHAMDNDTSPGADFSELVHLSFSTSVDLASVAAGWTHSDSDAMVFRWTGTTAPTLTSFTPQQVQAGNGWTLVASSSFSAGSLGINQAGDSYSSHWLVTTAFGGASDGTDGFKLKTFTGAICTYTSGAGGCTNTPPGGGGQASEPGSLALAAMAALSFAGLRRRKGRQA
jgi:hypothetical protein